jgi:hypothetical protein
MTDYPRFQPNRDHPDRAHLRHQGGRLVDFVLRLADHLRQRKLSASVEAPSVMTFVRRHAERPIADQSLLPHEHALSASIHCGKGSDGHGRAFARQQLFIPIAMGLIGMAIGVAITNSPLREASPIPPADCLGALHAP